MALQYSFYHRITGTHNKGKEKSIFSVWICGEKEWTKKELNIDFFLLDTREELDIYHLLDKERIYRFFYWTRKNCFNNTFDLAEALVRRQPEFVSVSFVFEDLDVVSTSDRSNWPHFWSLLKSCDFKINASFDLLLVNSSKIRSIPMFSLADVSANWAWTDSA